MKAPLKIAPASELPASQPFCQCCERSLRGRFAWLEHDQRTGTFTDAEDVPAEKSQGWFPFGLTCARKALAEHAAATKGAAA